MPRMLLIATILLFAVGCGRKGKENSLPEVSAPGIDIETDLAPGTRPEAILQFRGLEKPSRDVLDKDFTPHLIRRVAFENLWLELNIHTENGLYGLTVRKRWDKPLYGYKVGDILPIQDIPEYQGEPAKNMLGHWRLKSRWPDAQVRYHMVDATIGGTKQRAGEIVHFWFEDGSKQGSWQFKPR
jgi:hypothetical protein